MRRALIAATLAALALATQPAFAASATAVSSNWSGYAVAGTTFSSVNGSWVQPAAHCSSIAAASASAFWVGLGGNSTTSNALEQTGTEADCLANGTVRYSAWYELLPASSVRVSLKVHAGDRIAASVKVSGTAVTVRLKNETAGKTFAKTLRMAVPDISSAEWIAEAPSALAPGGTRILQLTDFGKARFTGATATSTTGHTGTISDAAWNATKITLDSAISGGGGPGGSRGPYTDAAISRTAATPSKLTSSGSAFAVTCSETASAPDVGV